MSSKKPSKENKNIRSVSAIAKEEEIYYIIDYKNKLKEQSNIIVGSENKERTLSFQKGLSEENDASSPNQSLASGNNNNNSGGYNYIDGNIEKIISAFTEKLFPKCNQKGFTICTKLSKEYFKKNGGNIDKVKIEKSVNYIHSNKQNYTYNNNVKLDSEFINNFGYILMASFFQFEQYQIHNKRDLKTNIKLTLKEPHDVLLDFFNYCKEKNYDCEKKGKAHYWDKYSKNYYIPGIFIFLINIFEKIENIEVNFEDYDKELNDDDLDFFTMFVYNIEYIFYNIKYVKINLNNKIFQRKIYVKAFNEYKSKLKKVNNNIKKRILNIDNLYNIKWDFQTDFLLNEHRKKPETKNEIITKESFDTIERSKTDSFNLWNLEEHLDISSEYIRNNTFDKEIQNEEENYKSLSNKTLPDYKAINKSKENPMNFIKIILILINGLNRIKDMNKIDLVINNSYSEEISNYFKKEIFETDNDSNNINILLLSKIKDFHILDLIFSKLIKLKEMNCEINSLDSSTFTQILKIFYVNTSLSSLNISFFTSDISYLQQSLYKLYNISFPDVELNLHGDVEKKIIEKLLPIFSTNLASFFDMLKLKSMKNLGINMALPDVLENNEKYLLLIIKFIINIIIYIYRKENNNPIEKVVLLCPKIILNKDYYPFIDDIFSRIDKNNVINMKELSFQFQLYKIINIKKIINESLLALNIGNCDIVTFQSLVNYLTSYKFSNNSNLKKISLGLIKTIRNMNRELYSLLYQIFNIKIKNLLELNVSSGIKINNEKEYFIFLNIFNNNWIAKSTFILNENSEEIINKEECIEKRNNIKYLIPFGEENECLDQQEKKKMVSIRKNDEIKNDDIFWILKYIFIIRFSCKKIIKNNQSLAKFLTNNILSYIHFSKNMDIQHYIN